MNGPPKTAPRIDSLLGQTVRGISVVTDENGVTCVHLLGNDGNAFKIEPGDPGYLDVTPYSGWRIA